MKEQPLDSHQEVMSDEQSETIIQSTSANDT